MFLLTQSLPLHRDYKPQAPLRDGVQNQGHKHEREQGGCDKLRQVHILRRVRLSVPVRRDNGQVIYARRY